MNNLIAYVPVLNRQYLDWLKRHQPFRLFLISQEAAEALVPRLARNLVGVSVREVELMINSLGLNGRAEIFSQIPFPCSEFVMPDEDVCREFAQKQLRYDPLYMSVTFEPVWGRWDMTAVKRQEPVVPDLEVSSSQIDLLRMEAARKLARKSPDWWRQIAAIAFRGEGPIAAAYNGHYPNEYEVAIFGDPRINFDAGDPAGAEVYLSLHAEKGTICYCGRKGIPLEGSSLYVTEFPCPDCARWIVAAGFKEVFFGGGYSMLGGLRTLQSAGIRVVKVKSPESA